VLDVGCGAGWLSRLLAERLPEGRVVGMDISDEMVRRARKNYVALDNTMFVIGGVDEIPWDANFFTRAISVESAYYWPDPARGLREFSASYAKAARRGPDQVLPRKPGLPSMGRSVCDAHAVAGAEEWAALSATPASLMSHIGKFRTRLPSGKLFGSMVPRCRSSSRLPRTGALLVHG